MRWIIQPPLKVLSQLWATVIVCLRFPAELILRLSFRKQHTNLTTIFASVKFFDIIQESFLGGMPLHLINENWKASTLQSCRLNSWSILALIDQKSAEYLTQKQVNSLRSISFLVTTGWRSSILRPNLTRFSGAMFSIHYMILEGAGAMCRKELFLVDQFQVGKFASYDLELTKSWGKTRQNSALVSLSLTSFQLNSIVWAPALTSAAIQLMTI